MFSDVFGFSAETKIETDSESGVASLATPFSDSSSSSSSSLVSSTDEPSALSAISQLICLKH